MPPRIIVRKTENNLVEAAFQIFCGGYFDEKTARGNNDFDAVRNLISEMRNDLEYQEMNYEYAIQAAYEWHAERS